MVATVKAKERTVSMPIFNEKQKARFAELRDERIAKRNAAIPARLARLFDEFGFYQPDPKALSSADEHFDKTRDERTVELWNAIVDADASL